MTASAGPSYVADFEAHRPAPVNGREPSNVFIRNTETNMTIRLLLAVLGAARTSTASP